MNRLTDVVIELNEMAAGNKALPTKEQCRDLAIKLGTPKELWPKYLK